MANPIRVVLEPTPQPRKLESPSDPPNAVRGLRVSFSQTGKGESKAKPDSPQPAKLAFRMKLSKRAKGAEPPEVKDLAELEGSVLLRGGVPVFVNTKGPTGAAGTLRYADAKLNGTTAETDSDAQPAAESGHPRQLHLQFAERNFQGIADLEQRNSRLLLPAEVNDFHFLELEVKLEIAGAAEAPFETNDVLDVRLREEVPEPAPRYTIAFIDEVGEPIDGIELALAHDGQTEALATDSKGVASALALGQATAEATITNAAAVKDKLKQRWSKARSKPSVKLGEDVLVLAPKDLEQPLSVAPNTRLSVCIPPPVVLARLFGMSFELNKNFLLPSAIPSLRGVKQLYDEHPGSKLLIVGHADTSGQPGFNDPLSVKRADAVAQYLNNDVEAWLKRYDPGVPEKERWGEPEDLLMIASFPEFQEPHTEEPVLFYQKLHNRKLNEPRPPGEPPRKTGAIEEDGKIGPETRRALIEDYMTHDGTSLPAEIEVVTHGCGENFPLEASGEEIDAAPTDAQREPEDRRVELFFFDPEFGIQPAPPGKNSKKGSKEYPEWRRRARQIRDLAAQQLKLGIVVGWTRDLVDQLPPDLVLQLIAGDEVVEKLLSEGSPSGDHVLYEFELRSRVERLTLTATSDGRQLILWNDQPFRSNDEQPVWQDRLDDFLLEPDDPFLEPEELVLNDPLEEDPRSATSAPTAVV